jgi:formylglycine-generating enzyme required for sulfatase activity
MGGNPSSHKGDDLPVEQVSWQDCQKFCGKTGLRLPTEAEWEYACRAGSDGEYCFGDGESSLGEYAWYSANSGNQTHPVGQKKANAFGLHDAHGNVWEWCQDWYGSYGSSSEQDPQGPSSGSRRVFRGGSFGRDAGGCRSARRGRNGPGSRYAHLGVRFSASSK